jgi:Prenyltransferase and squalene oxidase repeat
MPPALNIPRESRSIGGGDAVTFSEEICLPYLRAAQNPDGGWGFRNGAQSRVEPTAWALVALNQAFSTSDATTNHDASERGLRYLAGSQLVDGSWPAAPGQGQGAWVTSLACWAFLSANENRDALAHGLNWLAAEKPGDAGTWFRFLRGFTSNKKVSSQNEALWGWSWTTGTASWVEPTAFALLVLRAAPQDLVPSQAASRLKLAEAMLFDRMCPGGGWNCGNPMVYGVPGEPQVSTTAWALLALREHADRIEIQQSLAWLEKNWSNIQSPASLALTQIGLNAFGRGNPKFTATLESLYQPDAIAWTVPVAAWAALAASAQKFWSKQPARAEVKN